MIGPLLRLADRLRHRARVRSAPADFATGRRAEDLAHRFLQRAGYRVIARNYRARSGAGEIDLIAFDSETVVFVEVKSRQTAEHGPPDRALDRGKEIALVRAARDYARRAGVPWERVRFDYVTVILSSPPQISHVRDALRLNRSPGTAWR